MVFRVYSIGLRVKLWSAEFKFEVSMTLPRAEGARLLVRSLLCRAAQNII